MLCFGEFYQIPELAREPKVSKMERKIKLKTLNTHITCKICRGYLVEATTVTECLHTFCKSCLVKHLEENNTCPSCQIVIHQSHPLQYISFDRTMQDIVFKLVPGLQDDEIRREREFYRARGLPCPRDVPLAGAEPEDDKSAVDQHAEADYHRQDEQISCEQKTMVLDSPLKRRKILTRACKLDSHTLSEHQCKSEPPPRPRRQCKPMQPYNIPYGFPLCNQEEFKVTEGFVLQVNLSLECVSSNLRGLNRRFLRCSAQATITHLKKFLAAKVLNAMDKYKDIDVLCNDELLGKDHTLKFVFVTRWRFKEPPMILQYRPRIDL
ncbi:hypothetical protein B566_EDAN012786 [Ephemera danica]|nr:hypothetical protein B566_EDAN012786 [Ephemera danica]